MTRRDVGLVAVIVVALIALVGSMTWAAYALWGPGDGMMDEHGGMVGSSGMTDEMGKMNGPMMGDGSGMMGGMMTGSPMMLNGAFGLPGAGPVDTLEQARTAAEHYAGRLDLQVGEVMEFDNGFYAELIAPDGSGATEVLVDPDDGDVRIEFGPAMMWNSEYGMHPSGSRQPAEVSAADAKQLAKEFLKERGDDLAAGGPDAFPGYYTLHTLRDGEVTGMLSVNASSGMVWYHTWHGEFVEMSE